MLQAVQSRSGEYRKLWSNGGSPSLEQLLRLCEAMPIAKRTELLLLDQSMRWNANEPVTAEQYLELFPDIQNHSESAIDIVYSEYLVRERLGLNPVIDEYMERFPKYAFELQSQDTFHRAMSFGLENQPAEAPSSASLPDDGTDATPQSALNVPGYQILGELGRGGIGVVYKARHLQLNRYVALKMLLSGPFANSSSLRRFLVEAEATARLQHPNIIQIFEVGEYEGRPFLALEFVNGGTLSAWTDGRPQTPRDAACIVRSLANASHFAHEQGVVHRDLKPGNVLIQRLAASPTADSHDSHRRQDLNEGNSGSKSVHSKSTFDKDFQIKIADFGLAKLMAGGSDAGPKGDTASGMFSGQLLTCRPNKRVVSPPVWRLLPMFIPWAPFFMSC